VGKEQVADGDLTRLDPGGATHWLNDEIINFYGALILERAEKVTASKENRVNGAIKKRTRKPEYLNVHYFSTFFWPKIQKNYKETRLNKWTKKVRPKSCIITQFFLTGANSSTYSKKMLFLSPSTTEMSIGLLLQ